MQHPAKTVLLLNLIAGFAVLLGVLSSVGLIFKLFGTSQEGSEGVLGPILALAGYFMFHRKNWARRVLMVGLAFCTVFAALITFSAVTSGDWGPATAACLFGAASALTYRFLESPPVNSVFGKPA